FDWPFFGDRMRIMAKYWWNSVKFRKTLGIDSRLSIAEVKPDKIKYPPEKALHRALTDDPSFPVVVFGTLGKVIYGPDSGERPRANDMQ
ncbi:MAG TPA: hypothetical protein VMX75_07585, partial [Spirochaetia bacterium]|nr:hypothetical protein [Spirochaetia bacterium]